jgi:competence ComEA-like helix-hairpin-helix protein
MTPPAQVKLDLTWTRRNVAAVLALCAVAAALTAWRASSRPVSADCGAGPDPARLAAGAERINPNDASVASLRRLPGIGPKLAAAVVAHRDARGPQPFRYAEDLAAVRGIGPRTAQRLAAWLSLPLRSAGATTRPSEKPDDERSESSGIFRPPSTDVPLRIPTPLHLAPNRPR